MGFVTKSLTTATGSGSLAGHTFTAQIVSKDPIRSLTINNLSAVNIFFTLGEKVTETSDVFTIPPSTEVDFDVWEMSDEDTHYVVVASDSAATVAIIYKYGPPVKIGLGSNPSGPKVAISA
jgi:hypothetical protein